MYVKDIYLYKFIQIEYIIFKVYKYTYNKKLHRKRYLLWCNLLFGYWDYFCNCSRRSRAITLMLQSKVDRINELSEKVKLDCKKKRTMSGLRNAMFLFLQNNRRIHSNMPGLALTGDLSLSFPRDCLDSVGSK